MEASSLGGNYLASAANKGVQNRGGIPIWRPVHSEEIILPVLQGKVFRIGRYSDYGGHAVHSEEIILPVLQVPLRIERYS
jgi:hypothetical protein